MNIQSGKLDRRIQVQISTPSQDGAGDEVQNWTDLTKRWANRIDSRGREFFGAQQMVRDADTVFELRADSATRAYAPETHRFIDRGRIFEIVGICEGKERGDTLLFGCASSPAQRGARAPVDASA
jgi:SPP1 family predicted phage head-tail adaptor